MAVVQKGLEDREVEIRRDRWKGNGRNKKLIGNGLTVQSHAVILS